MEAGLSGVRLRTAPVRREAPAVRWPPPLPAEVRRLFLSPRRVAVAGMVADPQSVEFVRAERLLEWGFQLFPVHSRCGELLGHECCERLTDVPGPIDVLLVLPTNRVPQSDLAAEAICKPVKVFWVEDAPLDRAVAAALAANGIAAVDQRSLQVEVALQR